MLAPWKESYDQHRQHIQKQRHYFANKGPSSQGYGFSSSHVWMWKLEYKESWVLKNWCFWTVVLEKSLESPLDFKVLAVHGTLKSLLQHHSSKASILRHLAFFIVPYSTTWKTSISALLTMPKPLTVWITINCGKFWKRSDLPLEKFVCRSGSNS